MKKKVAITILVGVMFGIAIIFRSDRKELIDITKNENNTLAFFVEENDSYTEATTMPTGNYKLNEEKSFCTNNAKPTWNNEINALEIMSLDASNTNCYLYFDEACKGACKTILGNVTAKDSTTSFTGVATTNEGVFKTKDDDGDTYYFRGAVDNNYVKFANKYWRIIRINGDGTIRLIYDGTSAHANGTSTSDSIAVASQTFNASYNDNMYVGFMYTANQVHGLGTPSNALAQLETWYTNNLASYAAKIDTNAGFCEDREPSTVQITSNGAGGIGTTTTYYGAYIRMFASSGSWRITQTPTFKCKNSSDLYTMSSSNKGNKSLSYPIGLISADEVVYAGGFGGTANQSYYLYNGQDYWTLSPFDFVAGQGAYVFSVFSNGNPSYARVTDARGVRPVINLKADTTLTFNGTGEKGSLSNPYIVEEGN